MEESRSVLTEGKYAGLPVDWLSGPEMFEGYRSCRDSHDLELFRSEKRRRRYLAKKILWQTAQARKDRDNEYPRF